MVASVNVIIRSQPAQEEAEVQKHGHGGPLTLASPFQFEGKPLRSFALIQLQVVAQRAHYLPTVDDMYPA